MCAGEDIIPITFEWGGSATGIRIINNPGLTVVTNNVVSTTILSGAPTGSGFVRVETLQASPTCGVVRLDHWVNVVTTPSIPDYIQISDPNGINPDVKIVADQDGNIYNGQLYSCETALNAPPAVVTFSACYNNGRVLGLTDSYRWYVTPVNAGSINALTGVMSWTSGFFGDATISVAAVGCDGTETGVLSAVVTVNEFDATATQPTQPTPLLEAQIERVYFSQFPVTGERYSVFINGVEYFFVTTDLVFPFDSAVPFLNGVDQDIPAIAAAIVSQINADNTSLVKDLLITVPARSTFVQGDVNSNGLADDVGAFIDITASYDGYSAPAIPPGGPRGYGGPIEFRSNVEPAPGNARAFGQIRSETLNDTSMNLCGTLTGAEPLCKTTATTPNTQYFSTAGFYSTISFTLDIASIIPGTGSVGSPGSFVSSFTGDFNWNDGFHGTFNIESQAVGCDGVAFGTKAVRTVRIYDDVGPPNDITYNPLTVPNCPPINGTTTTQFSSSSDVTWSISTSAAGVINSSTGLMTWTQGWSGSVNIIATSFGCGDPAVNTFTRSIKIEGSPDFIRTSAIGTINQIVCSGNPLTQIRYEITGGATGADVTGEPTGVTVNTSSVDQLNTVTLSDILAEAGDTHTVRINGVNYTVTVGEVYNAVLVGVGASPVIL